MKVLEHLVLFTLSISLLSSCAPQEDPDPYIRDLYSRDPAIRKKAGYALIRIGKPAVPGLIEELKSPEPTVRYISAQILGKIRDKTATIPLISLLEDSESIAAKAAEALGRLGDERAIGALIKASSNTSPKVRASAVSALGKCRSDEAYEVVLRALEDTEDQVKVNAMDAVIFYWRYGYKREASRIIKLASDPSAQVRYVAVQALGQIGGEEEEAFEALVKALEDSYQSVRVKAVESLEKIGDKRAVGPLTDLFVSGTEEDREAAGKVLEKLTGRKYIVGD